MPGAARSQRRAWERLLRRTRILCTDAAQQSLGEAPLQSTIERVRVAAEDLEALLQEFGTYDKESVWELVGKDNLVGVVALFALALRRSAPTNPNSAERAAFWSLRASLSAHLERFREARAFFLVEPQFFAKVLGALVRTQSISCYSLLLAEFGPQLDPTTWPCPRRTAAMALAVVKEALTLLVALAHSDDRSYKKECTDVHNGYDASAEIRQAGLLEHCARTLLLASRCEAAQGEAAALLPRLASIFQTKSFLYLSLELTTAQHSLAWLMTSHLVGLAAVLDGGTMYGMPAEPGAPAAAGLPLDDTGRRLRLRAGELADTRFAQWVLSSWRSCISELRARLRQPDDPPPFTSASSLRNLGCRRLLQLRPRFAELQAIRADGTSGKYNEFYRDYLNVQATLDLVEDMLPGLRVPPFKVAATWDVSMRLADAAMQALAALPPPAVAEPAVSSATAQQQQHPRPRVPPDQAASLGLNALQCARAALWDVGWATEAEHPLAKLQQLQRWWDLTARFVRAASVPRPGMMSSAEHGGDGWEREAIEKLIDPRAEVGSAAVPLPLEPSADVAAALRTGLPQLIELLIRRPASTKERAAAFCCALDKVGPTAWAQLLAFADPRAVASLLTTAAKQTRRAALQLDAAAATARAEYAALGIEDDVFESKHNPALDSTVARHAAKLKLELVDAQQHARAVLRCVTRIISLSYEQAPFEDPLLSFVTAAAGGPSSPAIGECGPEARGSGNGGGGVYGGSNRVRGSDSNANAGGISKGVACSAGSDGAAARQGDPAHFRSISAGGDTGAAAPGPTAPLPNTVGADSHHAQAEQRKRLAAVLSQVAVRVMPEAVRLTASLAPGWGPVYAYDWQDALCVTAVLVWVPPLACAAAGAGAAGATPGARAEGDENPSQPGPLRQQAAPASVAAAAEKAAEWERFLWAEIGLPRLLGCGLRMIQALVAATATNPRDKGLEKAWLAALRAAAHLAPRRLAAVLRAAGRGAAVAAATGATGSATIGGPRAGAAAMPSLARLREVLGPQGILPEPELLAALERAGAKAGDAGAAPEPPPDEPLRQWVAATALLVPPGEVRAALPTCDNPRCTNLEGDSEAGLRLAGCRGCGGRVRYCSKECQMAHWRAGHKAECAGAPAATI